MAMAWDRGCGGAEEAIVQGSSKLPDQPGPSSQYSSGMVLGATMASLALAAARVPGYLRVTIFCLICTLLSFCCDTSGNYIAISVVQFAPFVLRCMHDSRY
jgi:hypothetical protein